MLAACSKTGTQTQFKISSSFAFGAGAVSAIADGGLMIWGMGPNGKSFGRVLNDTLEFKVSLPNGNWTFYAMAWDKITLENLSGTPHCAQSKALLDGNEVAIDLALSNSSCSDATFAGNLPGSGSIPYILPATKIEFCEKVDGTITTYTDECTDDLASVNRKFGKGHGASYRFRARAFDKLDGTTKLLAPEILSACYDGTPPSTQEVSGLAWTTANTLPGGIPGVTPFHFTVDIFLGTTDCDALETEALKKGKISHELPSGMRSTVPGVKTVVDSSGVPARHKIYLEVNPAAICSGIRIQAPSAAPFAAGTGSEGRQYLICNAQQLQSIVTADFSKHYKIIKNINLNPYTKGLPAPAGWVAPSWYSCLEKGSNFFPIGGFTGDCGVSAPTPLTGTFNGNGKSITGMRIRLEDAIKVGMIAEAGNKISNLIMNSPEVSGKEIVGIFAGSASGVTQFLNIKINNAVVEARYRNGTGGTDVGTLVGVANFSNIFDITINKTKVRGDRGNVGGLVGIALSTDIQKTLVSGEVRGSNNNLSSAPDFHVGGLAGLLDTGNVVLSRFEGYVRGWKYLGGLIGHSTDTTVLESYAQAGIFSNATDSGIFAGGLFGLYQGTPAIHSVSKAFFVGGITNICIAGPLTNCQMGRIAGDVSGVSAADFTDIYSSIPNNLSGLSTFSVGTDVSTANAFISGNMPNMGTNFEMSIDDLPRLNFEVATHPCRINSSGASLSHAVQIGLPYMRGLSTDNPILVCNPTQFQDMPYLNPYHYKFVNYVAGFTHSGGGPIITATIDGDGFGILGVHLQTNATDGAFLFEGVNSGGIIKNLSLYAPDLEINHDKPVALLVQTHDGTLDKVNVDGLKWETSVAISEGAGLVHVVNGTGRILNSSIDLFMKTTAFTGGVTFTNWGEIRNVRVSGRIENADNTTYYLNQIGGVAVANNGDIKQIDNKLKILDEAVLPNADAAGIGLISASNSGTIEDIYIGYGIIKTQASQVSGISSLNIAGATINRVIIDSPVIVENVIHGVDPGNIFAVSATVDTNFGSITNTFFKNPGLWIFPTSSVDAGTINASVCDFAMASYSLPSGATRDNWILPVTTTPSLFGLFADQIEEFFPISAHSGGILSVSGGATTCGKLDGSISHKVAFAGTSPGTQLTVANNNFTTFNAWNSTPWTVANEDDPTDIARMMDIHIARVTGLPIPESPIWEYSALEGMRLFELEKD